MRIRRSGGAVSWRARTHPHWIQLWSVTGGMPIVWHPSLRQAVWQCRIEPTVSPGLTDAGEPVDGRSLDMLNSPFDTVQWPWPRVC
jgi:hypothetical protein